MKKESIRMIKTRPSGEILLSFQQSQIDFLFTQLIHKPWGYACWQPFVDVVETPDAYIVTMDLPGVDPRTVRVHLDRNKVTIEGQRVLNENLPAESNWCCAERPRGIFLRTINIEAAVETDIMQTYEQGVLTITLKKKTDQGELS